MTDGRVFEWHVGGLSSPRSELPLAIGDALFSDPSEIVTICKSDEVIGATFRSSVIDDVIRVEGEGEIDLYTAAAFKVNLGGKIAAFPHAERADINLTKATFIDSTSLGVLVGGYKRLRGERERDDIDMHVYLPSRDLTKIFEITGLDRVFKVEEISAEALDARWHPPTLGQQPPAENSAVDAARWQVEQALIEQPGGPKKAAQRRKNG